MTQLRTYIGRHFGLPPWESVQPHVVADEDGQTLVEYALILGLIAIVAIVAIGVLSGNITNMFNSLSSNI